MQPGRSRYTNGIIADTHAALSSEDIVTAADTDILILMIYVYLKYMVKQRWVFICENDKCADIKTIFSYLGKWYVLGLSIFWNIFWKVDSSGQIFCVYDNFLLSFKSLKKPR